MPYREIIPGKQLQPYVKHYYLFESDNATAYTDTVFPVGSMEMVFNLGEGIWQFEENNRYYTTPQTEFWGQITRPLPIRSEGRHCMLGVRLYPHTAGVFLKEDLVRLNNQITDLRDLFGRQIDPLHAQLRETPGLKDRIGLIERFLLSAIIEKQCKKVGFIQQLLQDFQTGSGVNKLATSYNISPRQVHLLAVGSIGLPLLRYNKILRFQQSLSLLADKETSLTAIAYDCGYFDQAHFIRDFKSFTGITPSEFRFVQFQQFLSR